MAAVDTGKSFANGEQLTAAKLNQMFGNSTFASGAVDNSTLTVNSLGQLAVNQVTSSNIAINAINLDDIQQIDTDKVLGRLSASTGNVEQITVDEDLTSVSANHDELATSKAIKDYVDTNGFPVTAPTGSTPATCGTVTLPGGIIMKFGEGRSTSDDDESFTFASPAFPNNCFAVIPTITCQITARSTTGFTMNRSDTAWNGSPEFNFIAIGN
jgi:hypothetical protein